MTREEAIADIRDNIKPIVGGKSLDMAIKALEQEPCGYAVSRRDVEDAIAEAIVNGESLGYGVAYDILSDLPPVTPQQKMGQWIKDKCSICGEERAWYGQNPPYCPDCGAKMSEVEE